MTLYVPLFRVRDQLMQWGRVTIIHAALFINRERKVVAHTPVVQTISFSDSELIGNLIDSSA